MSSRDPSAFGKPVPGDRSGGVGRARGARDRPHESSTERARARGRGGGSGVPRLGGGGSLPGWVAEELARVTPRSRVPGAAQELEDAAVAFVAGRYAKARHHAEEAKALAPRLPAIREVLGLSAYRMGRWAQALAELRTYRRLSGDTTHLPIEMDVLRALERHDEVEAAYALLRRLGGSPAAMDEGRVVYASFLLDQDRAQEAWEVARPAALRAIPSDGDLRVWYVAGRAAARLGDQSGSRRLYEAIVEADPGFPGLDELEAALRG
ncbi:MAG: hypothetical protein ABIJ48_03555 [Actinomycetota bacterium]